MFNDADDNGVIIRKASEHGLGHLRSPLPGEGQGWFDDAWRGIVQAARDGGHPADRLAFADLPAAGKFPITKPSILTQFRHVNTKKVPGRERGCSARTLSR